MFGPAKIVPPKFAPLCAALAVASVIAGPGPAGGAGRGPSPGIEHRLVFIRSKLSDDRSVAKIESVVARSARLGFNGVVLDGGFDGIAFWPQESLDRLRRVKSICDENGVELIPLGFAVGYAGAVLAREPHLAAALPVREVPFVVNGGRGVLVADPSAKVVNGGFEEYEGERARGFGLQDGPGSVSRADETVRKTGGASLRFENFPKSKNGMGRVMQKIPVHPFRSYRVTLWVKTEGLVPVSRFVISVLAPDGRVLMTWRPPLDPTGEWRKVTFGFNSLSYREARVYTGVSNAKSGRFWLDDMSVEEIGILNVVRRPGTPVVVENAATGAIYTEGRDYERIADPSLTFRFDHAEPPLAVLPGGSIREGDRLAVSYYQGLSLKGGGQTCACMSQERLYEIWAEAVRLLEEAIAPGGYFLAMDEIREGGWCETCVGRGLGAGEILGDCVTRVRGIIKRANPGAEIMVWSDMLDPNHNAKRDFYLFNGDFSGSWNHIPKDVIIACWNQETRDASLRHFDSAGFRTMGCGYYDVDSGKAAGAWASSLSKTPGAWGIMYTTWQDRYDFLEEFAARAFGAREDGVGKK